MIIERGHGGVIWKIAIFFIGLGCGLALLLPISLSIPSRPQSEAVRLISTTYTPQSLCPGDVIDDFEFVWEVKRPAVIFVVASHLRASGSRDTAIGARAGEIFVTGIPSARTITDNDASFIIPDLPPGDYERVLSIGTFSEDSKQAFLIMPYTVRDDCAN